MEDDLIIKRLQRQDMATYEEVIQTYSAYVSSIVYSRIGNSMTKEDLEEVVSDVFFSLWQQRKKLNVNQGTVKNYLGILARNMAINKLREKTSDLPFSEEVEIAIEETPESLAIENDLMKYLKGEVNRLNSLEREIFFEYHFDGKTVERIAKDHQMNINTVKAKLARSRKKLRKLIFEGGVYL